jgi:hypothetical protein
MSPDGTQILHHLGLVATERQRRARDPALALRVRTVKAYQHQRFTKTYADLLASARYAKAARFFLDELYGPSDFSARDDQFARVVPALVRLFPHEIVATVRALAELHGISEALDTAMAEACPGPTLDAPAYCRAWQAVGRAADRERQIALMLAVGGALDRYTRNPVLRHTLRLMRGPARAAGMGALQTFLENGFDTFREMRGAQTFLDTVASRERALAAALFGTAPDAPDAPGPESDALLGQLP